jgi:L-asparaginase
MTLRRCAAAAAVVSVICGLPARSSGQPAPPDRPRVHLIATGGTIASRGPAQGAMTAEDLVAALPALADVAQVSFEQLLSLASDRILPEHWLLLARRVNQVLAGEAAGVVITHGTDTLEETAYFLSLTVASPKPVVVVGSMRRPVVLSSDGPANLLNAVRVAASPASRGRGTLVVLNDEIHAARDVTKTNTLSLDTFRSRTFGPLGRIDLDQVRYYRRTERRPWERGGFDVSGLKPSDLPRVDIAYVYAGADGAAIDAFLERGARGLVVAGTGSGGRTTGQREALARALEKDVRVVISSRTGSGVTIAAEPPMIRGDDLVAQKARILLMLALTRTSDPLELQEIFDTY